MTNQYPSSDSWMNPDQPQGTDPFAQAQPNQGNDPFAQPYQDPAAAGFQQYNPLPNQPVPAVAQPYLAAPVAGAKSKVAALLLAWFLGEFGAHNFYLGYTNRGVIQLVLCLVGWATVWFLLGIPLLIGVWIWKIVDFVLIIVGNGQYAHDFQGVPLQ